ncbi:MAG: alanyl-tRNA editing protein [Terriglobales bacterium]
MTERLYYLDPTLLEFDAEVLECVPEGERILMRLDRSAFYPTSGGQLFDTGWAGRENDEVRLRIAEVGEAENGEVIHFIEPAGMKVGIARGTLMHFAIDADRRRDHMEQHTGQHLLSAVFIKMFQAPTVSFHMGDESCTIDLDTKGLNDEQIRAVEKRANEIIREDAPVSIHFATPEDARARGVRKIPDHVEGKLRLIEIHGHDLNACGGTHVARTGEIGAILLRKAEKVKQGMRVEFVCGGRAIATARRDFETLTSAAALFSSHIYEVPVQVRRALDETKAAGKREFKLQEELAEFIAVRMVAEAPERGGVRVVKQHFRDRDLNFIKLLAQRIARLENAVALLACDRPQPSLVFSQNPRVSQNQAYPGHPTFDCGAAMKEAMATLGGRGGGTRDMAQGGAPEGADLDKALTDAEGNFGNKC